MCTVLGVKLAVHPTWSPMVGRKVKSKNFTAFLPICRCHTAGGGGQEVRRSSFAEDVSYIAQGSARFTVAPIALTDLAPPSRVITSM